MKYKSGNTFCTKCGKAVADAPKETIYEKRKGKDTIINIVILVIFIISVIGIMSIPKIINRIEEKKNQVEIQQEI